MLTNTHSVGTVHEATIAWRIRQGEPDATGYCWSNAGGGRDLGRSPQRHQRLSRQARTRRRGARRRGLRPGGRGQRRRRHRHDVLRLQVRHRHRVAGGGGARRVLHRRGVGAGEPGKGGATSCGLRACRSGELLRGEQSESGARSGLDKNSSIIIVVATDAPLLPHQLKRVAKRAALGLARTGSFADNGSGDIFIAFSTADRSLGEIDRLLTHRSVPNDDLDPCSPPPFGRPRRPSSTR